MNKEQFAFQNKTTSTAGAVLCFTETEIQNHENGKNTAETFLDLAKAFNSILHTKILLKKAECFNISEPAVNLLKSFLEERSH